MYEYLGVLIFSPESSDHRHGNRSTIYAPVLLMSISVIICLSSSIGHLHLVNAAYCT